MHDEVLTALKEVDRKLTYWQDRLIYYNDKDYLSYDMILRSIEELKALNKIIKFNFKEGISK